MFYASTYAMISTPAVLFVATCWYIAVIVEDIRTSLDQIDGTDAPHTTIRRIAAEVDLHSELLE